LFKDWFGGIARGFFVEDGLYDSSPLEAFLKREFDNVTPKRNVDIGIVDINSGRYVDFSSSNITNGSKSESNLDASLFASMSFAGFVPPA